MRAGIRFGMSGLIAATCLLTGIAHADDGKKPWDQADAIYGADAMQASRTAVLKRNGDKKSWLVMLDRFETQWGNGQADLAWEGTARYGGDMNQLWLHSEGEASLQGEGVEEAELQALYSRSVTPFWNLQAGGRYDSNPNGHAFAVARLEGLAPYLFEITGSAFWRDDGRGFARLESEYDLRLSSRWVLQPRIEAEFALQDDGAEGIGHGLSHLDAGLRLRYEMARQWAPYVGVEWQGDLGRTRTLSRLAGDDPTRTVILFGVRAWH